MEYKAIPVASDVMDGGSIKSIFAVTGNTDLGNDVIERGAFAKTLQERLPIGEIKVLWQHDADAPPIGTFLSLQEVGASELPRDLKERFPDATGALVGEWMPLPTQRSQEVVAGIKARAITQNSIGFDPIKPEYKTADGGVLDSQSGIFQWQMGNAKRHLKEVRLYDGSPVNWGMNPATMNLKAAIPYKQTPCNMDAAWDAGMMMGRCDQSGAQLEATMRAMCAWVDPSADPETKAAYKFPHHMIDGSGKVGAANYKACVAGIAVLNGGMGGAKIPEGDRQGVYNHLAHHIRDGGAEPPELKSLDGPDGVLLQARAFSDYLARNEAAIKAGRVLSDTNYQRIAAAHQHLQAVLASAEPSTSDSGKTLTDEARAQRISSMLARLGYMERELALIE